MCKSKSLIFLLICILWPGLGLASPSYPDFSFAVTDWAGIGRTNEIICSGVPLPRAAQVFSTSQLHIETDAGQGVPASFHPLARWNSGLKDTNAPLQWVLIEMPASVPAWGTRRYRLVISDSPPASIPSGPKLQLTETNGQVQVNTGAAIFTLGQNANLLFDEVRLADGTWAATGQPLTAAANGTPTTHVSLRRRIVERVSDLAAVVVIDGLYDLSAVGDGRLASSRRYQFFAGSPTVLIRHEVAWEGSLFSVGVLASEGVPNGVRVQQVRDAVEVPWNGPRQAWIWGDRETTPVEGNLLTGQPAWLKQQLRLRREDPLSYEIGLGGVRQSGQAATGGILAISDGAKTLAVALNHMHCYEPQTLACLTNGWMAVDAASDQTWLGARQGLFANYGLYATTGPVNAEAIKSSLWAKLNYPLRAWPNPGWFASAKVTDEFPVGELAPQWREYDQLVPAVLSRTTNLVHQLGLPGLQTYGLFPRYWGNPAQGYDELTNAVPANDPTPAEAWDDVYWGATWTDYHNTSALAAIWAMRSGKSSWLDEISCPAAWRMLHTQIIHGAPEDTYFYIGQAPAGYGGYRADFNSSHAYFDNLMLYYWLTGDYTVVETLRRGAATMRQYFYPERPQAPCDPLRPAPDEWSRPVGRVASQWIQVFRFAGLAGDDPSFLEDYRGNLARAVTQHYAELQKDGQRFGFWCEVPLTVSGTNHTDQIWMLTLYDFNNLYRWSVDSEDAPLGVPPQRPSAVLSAWAHTLTFLAPHAAPAADGAVHGQWPNAIEFTWTGDRLGGQLLGVTNYEFPAADPYLWDTGKAVLCATISRMADGERNAALRQMAADLATLTLKSSWNQGTPPPLGKEQGLYLSRLHPAISRLNLPWEASLKIDRQDQRLLLSWPSGLQNGQLETSSRLDAGDWKPILDLGSATNTWLEFPPASNAFFRLRWSR